MHRSRRCTSNKYTIPAWFSRFSVACKLKFDSIIRLLCKFICFQLKTLESIILLNFFVDLRFVLDISWKIKCLKLISLSSCSLFYWWKNRVFSLMHINFCQVLPHGMRILCSMLWFVENCVHSLWPRLRAAKKELLFHDRWHIHTISREFYYIFNTIKIDLNREEGKNRLF